MYIHAIIRLTERQIKAFRLIGGNFMKIFFENLNERFRPAMNDFLKLHNITKARDGIKIRTELSRDGKIRIEKKDNEAVFYLTKEHQLFRSLLSLRETEGELYEEEVYFETLSAMFDGSQANSLMNVKSAKRMMLYLASMGYNMMMLYTEDCYEIESEPSFGNMRPRYSAKDFKELDDYAYSLGIELVGCIQTLGHLTEAIKKPKYVRISDRPDILMVGEDGTYELIEKMIKTVSENFRSRRIHLGLDEAWDLGRGNYLKKHGVREQSEIMTEHLKRITEITEKYGMHPMMWGDMFFRGKSATADFYDPAVRFCEEDKKSVPDDMGIIYWDYYHKDSEFYEDRMTECKKLSDEVIFAGCSRNVRTFGSHLETTLITTNPALSACKRLGVKEVIATVWGDDQRESSTFAVLPGLSLFAEHMYGASPSMETVEKRLSYAVEMPFEALWDIALFDAVPEYNGKNPGTVALSRIIMWQDILLGLYDKSMEKCDMTGHYEMLHEKMYRYARECKDASFEKMFDFYAALARVLSEKQYLGVRLYHAYTDGNKEELEKIKDNELAALYKDIEALRRAHREHYFDEYKPIGWEILDIRYGGAIMRIDTAIKRLTDYLTGKIEKIEELEEERLDFWCLADYKLLCSASRI